MGRCHECDFVTGIRPAFDHRIVDMGQAYIPPPLSQPRGRQCRGRSAIGMPPHLAASPVAEFASDQGNQRNDSQNHIGEKGQDEDDCSWTGLNFANATVVYRPIRKP
jgi:hypothetical protein